MTKETAIELNIDERLVCSVLTMQLQAEERWLTKKSDQNFSQNTVKSPEAQILENRKT